MLCDTRPAHPLGEFALARVRNPFHTPCGLSLSPLPRPRSPVGSLDGRWHRERDASPPAPPSPSVLHCLADSRSRAASSFTLHSASHASPHGCVDAYPRARTPAWMCGGGSYHILALTSASPRYQRCDHKSAPTEVLEHRALSARSTPSLVGLGRIELQEGGGPGRAIARAEGRRCAAREDAACDKGDGYVDGREGALGGHADGWVRGTGPSRRVVGSVQRSDARTFEIIGRRSSYSDLVIWSFLSGSSYSDLRVETPCDPSKDARGPPPGRARSRARKASGSGPVVPEGTVWRGSAASSRGEGGEPRPSLFLSQGRRGRRRPSHGWPGSLAVWERLCLRCDVVR